MLNPYAASSISERQRTPSTIASPAYLDRSDRTASRSPSTLLHFESTTVAAAAAAVMGGEDGYECTEDKSVGAVIKRL